MRFCFQDRNLQCFIKYIERKYVHVLSENIDFLMKWNYEYIFKLVLNIFGYDKFIGYSNQKQYLIIENGFIIFFLNIFHDDFYDGISKT